MRRKLKYMLAATAALALAAATPAPHPVTLDDIMALRNVSQPRISPSGNAMLFQVETTNDDSDATDTHIWRANWDGSNATPLTTRPKESETNPRWSPDGAAITFLSDRGSTDGAAQLWRMSATGGEAEKLTDLAGNIEDYAWAPNGKSIALIVRDATPKDAEGSPPKPIVIDRFQFKADVDGYLTTTRRHLYLFDVATRRATQLLRGPFDEALPAFSPDSRTIAFVSKRGNDPDRTDAYAMYLIAAQEGATPRALTHFDGGDDRPDWESPPAWSPDGTQIAYVHGGPPKLIEYGVHSLAVIQAAGGAPVLLTPSLDRNVFHPEFSPDGSRVRFLIENDRALTLAEIPRQGGLIQSLAAGRRVTIDYSQAANGHIALLYSDPQTPPRIDGWDTTGEHVIADPNALWRATKALAPVRDISFASKDGTEVHGFLLTPPGVAPGTKLPTILALHGGPQEQLDDRFDLGVSYYLSLQLLAANGYAVLAVNPRGSTGRGEKYAAGIYADWGHKDAEDALAAVDWAEREGIADPNRLGIGGWSYGGMLTNYVIARDHRFRAATSGAGISDILAGYGTDEYIRDYEAELGTPWTNTATWEKLSFPFLHANRITTPTLFMGGDKDFNVTLLNQEQMYQALRSQNVETKLIIYPGSFHVQTRPSFIRDRMTRDLAWFDAHVGGERK